MKLIFVLTLLLGMALSTRGQSKIVNQREVYDMIVKADIAHPLIVLKQAIHESANFKSKAAKKRNNIFGFRSGRSSFSSIEGAILAYKRWQDKRYKGGDYYAFLKKVRYAADKQYKRKVINTKIDFKLNEDTISTKTSEERLYTSSLLRGIGWGCICQPLLTLTGDRRE